MRIEGGRLAIEVPDPLAALAARCELKLFERSDREPMVRLRAAEGAAPREAIALGGGGGYQVSGEELRVWLPPDDSRAAEAALRVAFAVAFERQGGLLLHAAGIAFSDEGAWLAVGPSGCGKSTLAQHCADAGAEILSDETVGWLPDGTLWATPFRSTARFTRRGPLSPRPLAVLAFLEHGDAERLEPVAAEDAVRRLLPQAYRAPGESTLLHRVAALVGQRGAQRFRFRNHPGAGAFVMVARPE